MCIYTRIQTRTLRCACINSVHLYMNNSIYIRRAHLRNGCCSKVSMIMALVANLCHCRTIGKTTPARSGKACYRSGRQVDQ